MPTSTTSALSLLSPALLCHHLCGDLEVTAYFWISNQTSLISSFGDHQAHRSTGMLDPWPLRFWGARKSIVTGFQKHLHQKLTILIWQTITLLWENGWQLVRQDSYWAHLGNSCSSAGTQYSLSYVNTAKSIARSPAAWLWNYHCDKDSAHCGLSSINDVLGLQEGEATPTLTSFSGEPDVPNCCGSQRSRSNSSISCEGETLGFCSEGLCSSIQCHVLIFIIWMTWYHGITCSCGKDEKVHIL